MTFRHLFCVTFAAFALAACEPDAIVKGDPCAQTGPAKRGLGGSYVRQQQDTPSFAMLSIGGEVRRNGRLSSIVIGDYTFDARIDRDTAGAFKAARGSTAVPVEMFKDTADKVLVYDLTYKPQGGPVFEGKAVLGPPTPPSQVAANGTGVFTGPILLETTNLALKADTTPTMLTGTAQVTVQYGTRKASLTVTGLSGASPLPFQQITWTGLRVCGARLVSAGTGGFQLSGALGAVVNFAGASETSPAGAAVFDSRFFGTSATGLPTALGGAVLIQGDNGIISAIFVANP